jgi:hypothetical protein
VCEPSALVVATWQAAGNLERVGDDSGASPRESWLSFAGEQESGTILFGAAKSACAGEFVKEDYLAKAQRRSVFFGFFFAPLRLREAAF